MACGKTIVCRRYLFGSRRDGKVQRFGDYKPGEQFSYKSTDPLLLSCIPVLQEWEGEK